MFVLQDYRRENNICVESYLPSPVAKILNSHENYEIAGSMVRVLLPGAFQTLSINIF